MISKIGIADGARVIQGFEQRQVQRQQPEGSAENSADSKLKDTAEMHREGNLDPESIRLIETILEGETDH